MFLHTPAVSGDTLNALGSVVVQADAIHPDEYVITVVPASRGGLHAVHFPVESRVYPGLHVFLQAPAASGAAPDALISVVVQAAAIHPDE